MAWFSRLFGGRTQETQQLHDEDEVKRERCLDLTQTQIEVSGKSQQALDKALVQFRKCLQTFQERRKYLRDQQQLYLLTLRAMDREDGVDPSDSEEEIDERNDPVLRPYFVDSDEEGAEAKSSTEQAKDEEMEMVSLEQATEEAEREEHELVDEDNVIAKTKLKITPSNVNKANKSPEQLEAEMAKRNQLKNLLKKDIPKMLDEIDKRIMYYRIQIQILEERRNLLDSNKSEAEIRMKDENSEVIHKTLLNTSV
ncbi:ankyrin repeat domain-containing protein 26 [Planoprotostelium fungivorum]|uniref:Ankyrin repeat domain-containing protein 26 n=1 Tax=Planoprotostelium fungivorum TaxID=1890364 RepID=A0A2P6NPC2_9EUKA|nr:ankyrin repeat domain-containing protein 26 [Planoprotostelium fungivorum]